MTWINARNSLFNADAVEDIAADGNRIIFSRRGSQEGKEGWFYDAKTSEIAKFMVSALGFELNITKRVVLEDLEKLVTSNIEKLENYGKAVDSLESKELKESQNVD